MNDLNLEALRERMAELEDEQALCEERAYIASRLARIYETRSVEIEHHKAELCSLLSQLLEAERIYRK